MRGRGGGLREGLRWVLPVSAGEHLYVNLGRAYELDGRWDEARGVYEALLAVGVEAREPGVQCAALNRLAIFEAQRSFDAPKALELLERAREVAGEGTRELAETEWNLSQMHGYAWQPEEAISHGERSLTLSRKLGLAELEARNLCTLAWSCSYVGLWEECVSYAEGSRALYARLGEEAPGSETRSVGALTPQVIYAGSPPSEFLYAKNMEAVCLSLLAIGEVNFGRPRRGLEAGRKAVEISEGTKNNWTYQAGLMNTSHNLTDLGEYEEALEFARESAAVARRLPPPMLRFYSLTTLGNVLQGFLRLDEARRAYEEALRIAESAPVRQEPYRIISVAKLCANRVLAGEWAAAHGYARDAIGTRDRVPTRLIWIDFSRHHETEALLRGGDEELAREDVRRLGERVGSNRRFGLVHRRMLAALHRWDGQIRAAVNRLREAEALAGGIGLAGELWQIRAALGELYEQGGETKEARRAFAAAEIGVRGLAERIKDERLKEGFLGARQVQRILESSKEGLS